MKELPDEQEIIRCFHCLVPILTWWDPHGRGMLRGEYVLIADSVFHPKCWDEFYAANEPSAHQLQLPGEAFESP